MAAAWDRVPAMEREADRITTFIIFCEDTVNEPAYFRSFQKPEKVKINIVEGQLSSFKNVINTLEYCETQGLLENADGHYRVKAGTTNHVWSVYDRDLETDVITNIHPANDMEFSLSIQTAEHAGLKVAWSNDVFELWILLHFTDMEPGIWRHRSYIYDQLTAIFRTLPDQSAEMLAVTSRETFSYKNDMKKRKNFPLFVLPYLEERRKKAAQRAQALEAAFPVNLRFHQRNPCTRISHLVNSIRSFY